MRAPECLREEVSSLPVSELSSQFATVPALKHQARIRGASPISVGPGGCDVRSAEGREPAGIVEPGEVDALADDIDRGLRSFRDATTGEPLVVEVCRSRTVFPPGERMDRLPDLIVRWSDTSAAGHEAIESPSLGRILRATPGRIPNGRSGNHRPTGFLIARGPGIAAGARLPDGADILDLAPTALARLSATPTALLAGKVIEPLARS